MGLIEEIILFGTIKGCIYALIATGFTLIFAVAGILNLAHGTFFMLGAYFTYSLYNSLGIPLLLAILLAALLVGGVGILLDRLLLKPMRSSHTYVLVLTVAVAFAAQEIILLTYGSQGMNIPNLIEGSVEIIGVVVSWHQLLIVGITALVLLGLWLVLTRTRYGVATLAVSMDEVGARLVGGGNRKGVQPFHVRLGVSGRHGRSAYLPHPVHDPHHVEHAAHEGIRGGGGWRHRQPHRHHPGFLSARLAGNPDRLSHLTQAHRGCLPGAAHHVSGVQALGHPGQEVALMLPKIKTPDKMSAIGFYGLVLALFYLMPVFTDNFYVLSVFTTAYFYIIFATSWDVFAGYAHLMNFGHALFIGLAGYLTAFVDKSFSLPPLVVLPMCALLCGALGMFIGYLTLRLDGPYFSMITIAFAAVACESSIIFSDYTGGEEGIPGIRPLTESFTGDYYFVLVVMSLIFLFLIWFTRGRYGLLLKAISQNEDSVGCSDSR